MILSKIEWYPKSVYTLETKAKIIYFQRLHLQPSIKETQHIAHMYQNT